MKVFLVFFIVMVLNTSAICISSAQSQCLNHNNSILTNINRNKTYSVNFCTLKTNCLFTFVTIRLINKQFKKVI